MSVEHFDQWYAAMSPDNPRDRLWQQHLGLPPELVSTSLLSMAGLAEIARFLGLGPDDRLLDVACGRGGYGMWLAREAGCRVVGVDFSAVAVAGAQQRVASFGLAGRADFRVGELEATGLPDGSVDAALCVDAVQFAADPVAGCRELRRVLAPGAPVALTAWEARAAGDEALPERLRRLDVAAALTEAGFGDVVVVERPGWTEVERGLWEAVRALDPGDDRALLDAREEAERVSGTVLARTRRVLATARA